MLEFSAQQIAIMIQGQVEGDASVTVSNFGKIEEATAGQISFLANPKYESFLYSTAASIIIISEQQQLKQKINATLIRVPDAYAAFATLLTKYQELIEVKLKEVDNNTIENSRVIQVVKDMLNETNDKIDTNQATFNTNLNSLKDETPALIEKTLDFFKTFLISVTKSSYL